MSVFFFKGGNVFLSKVVLLMKNVLVGFGWDVCLIDGQDFDLDVLVFLLVLNGKVCGDLDFIFYNNLMLFDGFVMYIGDNCIGEGDGDDELLKIKLDVVLFEVDKIIFVVIIYDVQVCCQSFGQVFGVFICLVNDDNQIEVVCYDLIEDVFIEIVMLFGELYCYNGEWKFCVVGQGYVGGLVFVCVQYGINVF